MTDDAFERHWQESPESKLELIDGRLIVGNSLRGSRYLLWDILTGWGPEAALALAPATSWRQALHEAFRDLAAPAAHEPLDAWRNWADRAAYTPSIAPAGPRDDWRHRAARDRLRYGPSRRFIEACFGPDVVMRLGENAWTPDLMLVGPGRLELLNEHYLDGSADIAIEVLLPGHEAQDREVKRSHYEAARVPEYWLVDPVAQAIAFQRLIDGQYRLQVPAADGRYRSVSIPGLAVVPQRLWEGMEETDWGLGAGRAPVLEVETPWWPEKWHWSEGGVKWGDVPFDPRPELEPRPLRFEEYASWCGRAKFEMIDGKPLIDGRLGTRNVLGMLLRSFGLIEAVTVLHPRTWVTALEQTERQRASDAAQRDQWWDQVRSAARLLHERYGIGRVTVIGDLRRREPLNVWSDVTLVVWNVPKTVSLSDAYHEIYNSNPDTCIADLRKWEFTTRSQRQEIEHESMDV